MIELRWAVPPGTTTALPVLQYRQTVAGYWPEDWQDVPRVVVTPEAPAITNKANRKLRLLTPAQREKLINAHHAVYRHPASFGALDALIRTVELRVASLPD